MQHPVAEIALEAAAAQELFPAPCRTISCLQGDEALHMRHGNSPFEEELLVWLKTDLYFTEYEKRYQKELAWKEQQIEKAYFRELFPLPERSAGKLEVLRKAEQGKPIDAKKASEALSELYAYDEINSSL